jgi:cobalt/nickel transport protein
MKNVGKLLIIIIAGLAVLIPFASTYPDGLEKVAESLGVKESQPLWEGLMPDYTLHTVDNPYLTKLISGLTGIIIVFLTAYGIGAVISRRNTNS